MFKQPVQQVREGFKDLDIGCPHLHRTLPPTVYSSDSDDDEEHERVPPVHDGDADDGDHWMGHPFPCSSKGSCGSQLRIIRAAAVHYPPLRKFLNLLYLARWHHRRVLNLDNALCSADFRELMKLTDIESYGALYKGSKGESGCACENSTPGLPNLEPQLKVRHAELITSLEKKVNDYPEHACCSCERLFQRKDVTSLKKSDHKFNSGMCQRVKKRISERNPDVCLDTQPD